MPYEFGALVSLITCARVHQYMKIMETKWGYKLATISEIMLQLKVRNFIFYFLCSSTPPYPLPGLCIGLSRSMGFGSGLFFPS